MIARIIRWSARNVFLVGLATIFVTLAGIHTVKQVPLDATRSLAPSETSMSRHRTGVRS
jgi:copper/silver efflux system protein